MNKQSSIKKQLKLTKRDSSLIRQLLKIPKAEPLRKSSSMNQLNAIHQFALETIQKTIQIQFPFNREEWKKHLKPIDFNQYYIGHNKPLYRTCYRYFNHERHLAFLDSLVQIIKIQTNYRSYWAKKQFYFKAKDYIEAKGINAIIIIQSKVKQFVLLKKFKLQLLINSIRSQRKNSFRKIEENMKRFYIQHKENMNMIYEDIVRKRTYSAIKLQSIYRQKAVHYNVQLIKEKARSNYLLVYPFKAEDISLKVYTYGNDSSYYKVFLYHFEYNSFLKSFVLFIPHEAFPSGKYRCQFIVDGFETCDGRYPHIEFNDGLFYNMIDFIRPDEINLNDFTNSNSNTNVYIGDLDETRTEEMLNQIDNDTNQLSSKCFFDEIKNIEDNEDILTLKLDLYGKKYNSKMEEIRREPFSKIELKFNK